MLLVLPLAVALWAYAGWDSGKQQAKTDARLQGWLQTAVADYSRILRDAERLSLVHRRVSKARLPVATGASLPTLQARTSPSS